MRHTAAQLPTRWGSVSPEVTDWMSAHEQRGRRDPGPAKLGLFHGLIRSRRANKNEQTAANSLSVGRGAERHLGAETHSPTARPDTSEL